MARPRGFDIDEALEAAMTAFWEHGYEATSLADLMDAMEIQKGSIYKAFGDKHSLFMRALERYSSSVLKQIGGILGSDLSAREQFEHLLEGLVEVCDQPSARRGCMAINSIVELAPHDEEVCQMVHNHYQEVERLYANAIRRGQSLNEFRDDLSAEELAEFFSIYVSGVLARSRAACPREKTQFRADLALKLLLR
ncbi:HTH-type transcriptional repressor ComR [Planctomycetes bacterium Pan216]|uniref:HTH-type transcriptional repressor ComR n=1 Tax=Kolteria novifilia TaxID=2527975 RepID=A0A518BAQ6_9BACT|nr:HTH-type transcriptional repressor ComR [Planctomycetes bacterium Pan216]